MNSKHWKIEMNWHRSIWTGHSNDFSENYDTKGFCLASIDGPFVSLVLPRHWNCTSELSLPPFALPDFAFPAPAYVSMYVLSCRAYYNVAHFASVSQPWNKGSKVSYPSAQTGTKILPDTLRRWKVFFTWFFLFFIFQSRDKIYSRVRGIALRDSPRAPRSRRTSEKKQQPSKGQHAK